MSHKSLPTELWLSLGKRLLILKGPSGAGKTATISTLAKAMGFDISEWRNPVGSEFSSDGFLSMSAQFEDFLGRSGKFGRLTFESSAPDSHPLRPPTGDAIPESPGKQVILLEEFPNTFTRTSNALQAFRSSIMQYLAVNTPSLSTLFSAKSEPIENVTPIIMIISETLMTSTTASADSFTAHRLLGHEILNHPGTSVIEFNLIAATFLSKALDLVIQKEARRSGRRRTPGPAVLRRLAEIGDVRSAIGSLEFLCIRGDENNEWSGRVAAKTKKGSKNGIAMTMMEKESMETITQREASLGIFHAIGKVVYNKRDEGAVLNPCIAFPPQAPDHLPQHFRLKVSQVDVNQLIDETGTDTQTFVAALHENYVLSCDDHSSTDVINDCIDALSDSDLLSRSKGRGNSQGVAADSPRQDEICFQVAVRGLLFALPCPVKRKAAPSSRGGRAVGKGDAFKMFYPTSLRLWKQTEEIESLVDAWIDHSMRSRASIPDDVSYKDVDGETGRNTNDVSNLKPTHQANQSSADSTAPSLLTGGNSGRQELILEILPYLTKISSNLPRSAHLSSLERITQIDGMTYQKEGEIVEEAEEITPNATEWATDRPVPPKVQYPRFSARDAGNKGRLKGMGFLEKEAEKLVLSNDDIEDD